MLAPPLSTNGGGASGPILMRMRRVIGTAGAGRGGGEVIPPRELLILCMGEGSGNIIIHLWARAAAGTW